MKPDEINKLRTGIAEILEVDIDDIKDDVHLVESLGADSFATLEILSFAENTFTVSIPPECLPRMTSLKRIIQLIDENI